MSGNNREWEQVIEEGWQWLCRAPYSHRSGRRKGLFPLTTLYFFSTDSLSPGTVISCGVHLLHTIDFFDFVWLDFLTVGFCYQRKAWVTSWYSQVEPKPKRSCGVLWLASKPRPSLEMRSSSGLLFIVPRRPCVWLVNSRGRSTVVVMVPSRTCTSTPAPEENMTVTFSTVDENTNTPRVKHTRCRGYSNTQMFHLYIIF